jgi:6-phosphogluconolactonase
MTLTYPALVQVSQILWLVTAANKKDPLARLLAGDTTIRQAASRPQHH